MNTHETELPLLAGIAAFIHWGEELLGILNGPILLLGAGIALVDLLTDGALTVGAPILLFAWACSQALGIDTQLLGCFARARSSSSWARVGWLLLGVILGYAAWQAGYVFSVQQSLHISESAALAQLGMPSGVWLGWRAFLAVGLVALSGWTRYRKPAHVALSLDEERARLERELTLEPMRQQLRAQHVGGIRALAQTALQGRSQGDLPAPPTGPGSPAAASPALGGSNPRRSTGSAAANVTRLPAPRAPRQTRRAAAQANARSGKRGTAEQRVRAILAQEPGISFDALVTRAEVSRSTASKYLALVESERVATHAEGQYAQ